MKKQLIFTLVLLGSFLTMRAQQVFNENIIAGNTNGGHWQGFKSNGATGMWGFQQNEVLFVGVGGNVYNRGFSANSMGIFNGTLNKEDIYLYNQNSPYADFLVLKASGNVGIGTVNPQALLDVSGQLRLGKLGLPGRIDFARAQDGNYQSYLGWASNEIFRQYFSGGGSSYRIASWGGNGESDLVTVQNNGNVGIGTTEPQAKLDIVGQINSYVVGLGQQTYTSSTKNYVNFSSNNHGSVLLSSNLYINGDDNLKIAKTHLSMSGSAILIPGNGQSNQGSILFYTSTPASVTADANYNSGASMIVKSNGNVGIGTTNPDSKLTVAGEIQSRKVKVTINAGADFVFEEDYELKKLEDLQTYIQQHKHLPEIPSAKEMEAKGIELGEMNIKLLQKIEELTLYLIEMKRENEKLKKENDERLRKLELENEILKNKIK